MQVGAEVWTIGPRDDLRGPSAPRPVRLTRAVGDCGWGVDETDEVDNRDTFATEMEARVAFAEALREQIRSLTDVGSSLTKVLEEARRSPDSPEILAGRLRILQGHLAAGMIHLLPEDLRVEARITDDGKVRAGSYEAVRGPMYWEITDGCDFLTTEADTRGAARIILQCLWHDASIKWMERRP